MGMMMLIKMVLSNMVSLYAGYGLIGFLKAIV
jgi:hypothetical protein